jgi:hypothetical protein
MKRLLTLMALFLLHPAVFAQGVDFVKQLSSIERAPVTSDNLGRVLGNPAFVRLQQPMTVGAYGSSVYIFDAGPHLFYRYDIYQETLQELPKITAALKGVPTGITVMPDLSFYVADPVGRQVIHGSLDGQVLRILSNDANLASPVATAFDAFSRNLLVADSLFDHIVGFNHEGWLLFAFGERGMEPHQSQVITDMASGPRGIYVLDRNPSIKIYTPEGKFINGFSRNEVANPVALAVDLHDRVYVADGFDDSIKVYIHEKYVGEFGGSGSAPGRFRFITDLAISQNFLYVADSMNGRVQVFVIERLYANQPQDNNGDTPTVPDSLLLEEKKAQP